MDAEVRLLPGQAGRTHIDLAVPTGNALVALEAILGMFALAGHKVRRINEEGEEIYSAKEVFPDGNPAMLLRGYRGKLDMTQKELAKKLGELFDTPYKSFL